jgi:N-acetylglutamate synthase-like GNAT family acetyltransferase
VRPATAADQGAILQMVRAAHLYPFGLHWPRFVVAESEGRLIGVGQVRPHFDGSRELASIAVSPGRQGQGVGSLIVSRLLAGERVPIYAMCRPALVGYYARFGFRPIGPRAMSPYFRLIHYGFRGLAAVLWLLRRPSPDVRILLHPGRRRP